MRDQKGVIEGVMEGGCVREEGWGKEGAGRK